MPSVLSELEHLKVLPILSDISNSADFRKHANKYMYFNQLQTFIININKIF